MTTFWSIFLPVCLYSLCACQTHTRSLFLITGFRSKARLPVVTYLHGPTGAVLTRSAQPMVGLGQKNCAADAKLLNLYRCKGKALEPK